VRDRARVTCHVRAVTADAMLGPRPGSSRGRPVLRFPSWSGKRSNTAASANPTSLSRCVGLGFQAARSGSAGLSSTMHAAPSCWRSGRSGCPVDVLAVSAAGAAQSLQLRICRRQHWYRSQEFRPAPSGTAQPCLRNLGGRLGGLASEPPHWLQKSDVSGAQERTRTFTALRPPAPEAGASTNSTTWARHGGRRRLVGALPCGCQPARCDPSPSARRMELPRSGG
jgi:hypothetical protein